jgi:hypothetical protein
MSATMMATMPAMPAMPATEVLPYHLESVPLRPSARSWIIRALIRGPRRVSELRELARKQGYRWGTILTVKASLGVIAANYDGASSSWVWRLPTIYELEGA